MRIVRILAVLAAVPLAVGLMVVASSSAVAASESTDPCDRSVLAMGKTQTCPGPGGSSGASTGSSGGEGWTPVGGGGIVGPSAAPPPVDDSKSVGEEWADVCESKAKASSTEQMTCETMSTSTGLVSWWLEMLDPQPSSVGTGWLTPYALCFGMSLILLVVVLMVVTARSADGKKVNGFELLAASGVKAYLFVPAMTALPALVTFAKQITDSVAETMMGAAGREFLTSYVSMLLKVAAQAKGSTSLISILLQGPGLSLLFIMVGLMVILGTIGMILELTLAELSLYVLTCVAPFAVALSVYPNKKGAAAKLFGVMVGVLCIKPVMWLVLWIGATVQTGTIRAGSSILASMVMIAVVSLAGAMIPALAPMFMSHLIGDRFDVWGHQGIEKVGRATKSVLHLATFKMPLGKK